MRITLTVTGGPHLGKTFTFTGHDMFLVGRSSRSHFHLSDEDRYFSRIHFLIEANPPQCRLLDMGSRNGTYVNDERVGQVDLRHGDKIQAGRTVLRVALEEVPPSDPTPEVVPEAGIAGRATLLRTASSDPTPEALPEAGLAETPVASTAGDPRPAPRDPSPPGEAPRCRACGEPAVKSAEGESWLCPGCREQAAARPQPIKGYVTVREVGQGAMGQVFVAVRLADGLPVALKTVAPAVVARPQQVDRFLREAKILSQLRHPNIVAYYDMGEADGLLYFAMDYVRGPDAHRVLADEGPLPVGRAVRMVCQLLDALEHAHGRKFVHRDIKPSNLLVVRDAAGETVKLADFGLARVYQASQMSGLTMSGEVGGTLGFMAPEQITDFREADPSADLYSAAATLYNLLTGAFIFDFKGDLKSRLLAVLQDDPVPIRQRRRDLPSALETAIHRSLYREPHKRWPDAASFRAALAPFTRGG
jgi:serine/threonine-protein kinase